MTTRYRSMEWDPQSRSGIGVWREFDEAELVERYQRRPGGWASVQQDLFDHRSEYWEVWRNGAWRPRSNWAVPSWELAAYREIAGLERERRQMVGKPQMRLRTARERLDAVRAILEDAQQAVAVAEAALKSDEDALKVAEKTAKAIEVRIKALRDDIDRRQAAEDARTPAAMKV